jgi:heme/copper-type cytochrome/quinol oxidase subunit 2
LFCYDEKSSLFILKPGDFSFIPNVISLVVNEKIRITLENSGRGEHDFEILGIGVHIHAQPGKNSSSIVKFEKAGTYKAICTLPVIRRLG